MGGVIASLFLALIKSRIMYVDDKIAAARRWVPILIGIMAGVFATYLAIKGLSKIVSLELGTAVLIGVGVGIVSWALSIPLIWRQSEGLENRKKSLKVLFGLPLVISAALLSFAHGANDVANAVGPLAAIVHAVQDTDIDAANVGIPLWVMIVGALGISVGLVLFGPKLIRLVGSEITKLNPMRAYCVALSAAITVIVASCLACRSPRPYRGRGGDLRRGLLPRMARRAPLAPSRPRQGLVLPPPKSANAANSCAARISSRSRRHGSSPCRSRLCSLRRSTYC